MTFEAYMNNIREKTGKSPRDFFDDAVKRGVLGPDTRPMAFVAWLKVGSGLGHGHAMAVWEAFKRNGWVPLPGSSPKGTAKRAAKSAAKGKR